MKAILLLILLTSASLQISNGQAGALDAAFGINGIVQAGFFSEQQAEGYSILEQPDHKILVSGYTRVEGSNSIGVLLRYLPDGTPDPDFNGNGKLLFQYPDYRIIRSFSVLQPDGRIVTAFYVSDNAKSYVVVVRFLANGTVDQSFGVSGIASPDLGTDYQAVKSIAIQPDGKILVGGYAGNANASYDNFFLIRLLPDGSPDPGFGNAGIVHRIVGETYTDVNAILVQPDGKIIESGYAAFDGYDNFAVVRYLSNGTPDASFGNDGISHVAFGASDARGSDAALQPDGKIVVGGYVITGAQSEFAAIRLLANGSLDNTFHADGKVTITVSPDADQARALTLQPDGRILLGGYAHSNSAIGSEMAIVRLNADGTTDFSFDDDGIAILTSVSQGTDVIFDMCLQRDGKILATGFVRNNGVNSIGVIRLISGLTLTGTHDVPFSLTAATAYPNPAIDWINIEYALELEETISIQLLDLQGRQIAVLSPFSRQLPGAHTERFELPASLPKGTYLLNMTSGEWSKAFPVCVGL